MKISEFFANEYVDQASYDNLRKISSCIDGQKNAARKILYTILEKNIKEKVKVSQLGSKVSEFAEYLHGNMDGVIVGMTQDFTGTNNFPLLQKNGNFGTRFSPEASASRYIYTHGSKNLWDLFNNIDSNILTNQYFEGAKIEPMFYVPNLPVLLLNGSEGVSSGFAQKILPRNPEKIKNIIISILNNKKYNKKDLYPYFNGFEGNIEQGDNQAQWIIKGKIKRLSSNKVEISEIPIGVDLKSYLDTLDNLEEKKLINSYKDKSENDKFLFEINIPSKTLNNITDDELSSTLKLTKTITENYTCLDENNKIKEFKSIDEIIEHYTNIKLLYLQKRKDYLITSTQDDIVKDLKKIEGIIERDNSYDYLLNMSIQSLTDERLKKLEQDIKSKVEELEIIKNKTINEMWLEDLDKVKT